MEACERAAGETTVAGDSEFSSHGRGRHLRWPASADRRSHQCLRGLRESPGQHLPRRATVQDEGTMRGPRGSCSSHGPSEGAARYEVNLRCHGNRPGRLQQADASMARPRRVGMPSAPTDVPGPGGGGRTPERVGPPDLPSEHGNSRKSSSDANLQGVGESPPLLVQSGIPRASCRYAPFTQKEHRHSGRLRRLVRGSRAASRHGPRAALHE